MNLTESYYPGDASLASQFQAEFERKRREAQALAQSVGSQPLMMSPGAGQQLGQLSSQLPAGAQANMAAMQAAQRGVLAPTLGQPVSPPPQVLGGPAAPGMQANIESHAAAQRAAFAPTAQPAQMLAPAPAQPRQSLAASMPSPVALANRSAQAAAQSAAFAPKPVPAPTQRPLMGRSGQLAPQVPKAAPVPPKAPYESQRGRLR